MVDGVSRLLLRVVRYRNNLKVSRRTTETKNQDGRHDLSLATEDTFSWPSGEQSSNRLCPSDIICCPLVGFIVSECFCTGATILIFRVQFHVDRARFANLPSISSPEAFHVLQKKIRSAEERVETSASIQSTLFIQSSNGCDIGDKPYVSQNLGCMRTKTNDLHQAYPSSWSCAHPGVICGVLVNVPVRDLARYPDYPVP